ncbi:hypothetical protein MNBD_NITROSPINAE03-679 [hydrothermal vent metagenome]|uniref:FlgO domain-containing protein n=1 Tax=hydrothermal vent metagenome TaxID=652676 RepID=A0A3B1BUN3_9ZZZZ
MYSKIKHIFIAIVTLFTLSACASGGMVSGDEASDEKKMSRMEALEEKILDVALELQQRAERFDPQEKTVAVTSFVDLDNLDSSSSFGRFVSERLSMEMHDLGFNVRELRQRKSIKFKRQEGEFGLTRQSADLMRKFQVDAVLAGTYLVVDSEVVVNARLIDVDSSRVISVGHMVVNLKQIRGMLPRNNRATPVVKVAHIDGD